jgi:hypothetical protein
MFRETNLKTQVAILLIALLACGGCGGPVGGDNGNADTASPLVDDEVDYVVVIILDLSGSYQHLMVDQGKAYRFAMQVIDKYFRQRLGNNDRLVIAQVSATNSAPLWEGTPLQLRQAFPDAATFKRHLLANSDPSGSRVHLGVCETLEYVMTDPRVASGKARTATFVLSDMEDNAPNTAASERRLVKAFSDYAKLNGVVGLYWVNFPLVARWQRNLSEAGYKKVWVIAGIVEQPPLPDFEQ